jgi:hypothetical protein
MKSEEEIRERIDITHEISGRTKRESVVLSVWIEALKWVLSDEL